MFRFFIFKEKLKFIRLYLNLLSFELKIYYFILIDEIKF